MAEFPSKVATETSPPQADGGQQGGNSLRGLAASVSTQLDMSFIRSIPAVLMVIEIVSGLLQWTLIATVYFVPLTVYGWVMFVAVTLWLLTTILFCMILFRVMLYNAVATILCLTAFLANAVSIHPYGGIYRGYFGAAAFFGAVSTVAYGASAFFSYLDWKITR
ncbi:hypothetical protein CRUP_008838 [Coryphaenoides rupestris]|nr:hypothetical protein CRUP_008838 [Coryphaenoides rupestris]